MEDKHGDKLIKLPIPVIGFYSAGERATKLKTLESVKRSLIKRGYKISQIINSDTEKNERSYRFPIDLFNTSTPKRQIVEFNHFVYRIYKQDNPDIILIEIPLGIVPISDEVTNDFGLIAFQVSNSVEVDIGVMNLYYEVYSASFYEKLTELFLYRFSVEYVLFNLLDKSIDWIKLRDEKTLKIMNAFIEELDIVKREAKEKRLYISFEKNEMDRLANDIEMLLLERICL